MTVTAILICNGCDRALVNACSDKEARRDFMGATFSNPKRPDDERFDLHFCNRCAERKS